MFSKGSFFCALFFCCASFGIWFSFLFNVSLWTEQPSFVVKNKMWRKKTKCFMRAFYSSLCIAFFSAFVWKTATKEKYLIESIELHFILKIRSFCFIQGILEKSTFTDCECNQQKMASIYKEPMVECKAHPIQNQIFSMSQRKCDIKHSIFESNFAGKSTCSFTHADVHSFLSEWHFWRNVNIRNELTSTPPFHM